LQAAHFLYQAISPQTNCTEGDLQTIWRSNKIKRHARRSYHHSLFRLERFQWLNDRELMMVMTTMMTTIRVQS